MTHQILVGLFGPEGVFYQHTVSTHAHWATVNPATAKELRPLKIHCLKNKTLKQTDTTSEKQHFPWISMKKSIIRAVLSNRVFSCYILTSLCVTWEWTHRVDKGEGRGALWKTCTKSHTEGGNHASSTPTEEMLWPADTLKHMDLPTCSSFFLTTVTVWPEWHQASRVQT